MSAAATAWMAGRRRPPTPRPRPRAATRWWSPTSTPPAAAVVALVSDTGSSSSDKITSNGALSVTGVESGASVQYSTNGGATWTSSFTAVEGANAVQVRQVDVAGNPTATPTSFSFTLDTTISTPTAALIHDTGSSSSTTT